MTFKSIGASALIRILAAGAALAGGAGLSAPAFANTASVDQGQVQSLAASIVAAVNQAKLSADCQNKADPKAQQACAAGIAAAIQQAIIASGASPMVAQAAMLAAQNTVTAAAGMDTPTAIAFGDVGQVVQAQLGAYTGAGGSTGAGAPAGPASSNSISSPPSSSGGGGYVSH